MSNHAGEVRRPHNKRKKKEASLSPLLLLPHDVALYCLSRLSRLDSAALSLSSKSHRSLVVSPDLCRIRELTSFTEEYCYICISIPPHPTPRWFILRRGGPTLDATASAKKSLNRWLTPIPSYPYQPPESSSFMVLDYGIYIIGGIIHGSPTREVLLLDCLSHTWHRIRSMRVARASAAANVIDGKIYVIGGCAEEVESSNWAEVFDPKTQTWDSLPLPDDPEIRKNTSMIHKSVVVEGKVYAVDEEDQSFYYLPSEAIWRRANPDSSRGNRKDLCAIGKLLYCYDCHGKILWCEAEKLERCETKELQWMEVKGLDVFSFKPNNCDMDQDDLWKLHWTVNGLSRLSSNSRGNIVVFWKVLIPTTEMEAYPNILEDEEDVLIDTNKLEFWSAEISLERRQGGEIWGTIEWAGAVSELDPLSYTVKVLYSVSVNV